MVTKIISDKIILPDRIFNGFIYIKDGKIDCVSDKDMPADKVYDFTSKYVSPGFVETHTHGGCGYSFLTGTVEDMVKACNFHLSHGTTAIAPTVSAAPFSLMREATEKIAKARRSEELLPVILGAHLEGPYLSAKQCGAQCPDFITPPNKEEYEALVAELGNDIVRWTYAPENDEGGEFCRFITEKGILASAGHTDATLSDMDVAIKNGCKLITHLYSCTSTVTRKGGFRSLGVIESAYLRDELFCEIIADGKHLPPELINMICKIKGKDSVMAVTDSLELAGTDATHGFMGATEYIIEDGVCKLCDRSAFAGSIATSDRLIRVLTKDCGTDLVQAVRMLTEIPAKLLSLNKGVLKEGFDADIAVFDENINIEKVFVGGNCVFEK